VGKFNSKTGEKIGPLILSCKSRDCIRETAEYKVSLFLQQSVCLSLSNLSPPINFISGYHSTAAVKEPTPRPYSVNVLIIDFVGNDGRRKQLLLVAVYRRLLSLRLL